MRKLNGLCAVITGASGGMGKEISTLLAENGVNLALFSNDPHELSKLAVKLGEKTRVISKVCDVRSETEVEAAFEEVKNIFGKADILINLAGLSIPAKLDEMNLSDYELTMDVNVKGTFLFSKHFAKLVSPDSGAQIINIGSMAAKRANANAPLYCTAKAAVNMLSAGMAMQFKEKGIRVTTLNPGGADTPFWGNRPVKRENLLKPSDIAEVVLFVLTRDNRVAFSEINFESFYNM
jgi:NADP-dependent 3-hydroxy acid dehydrogenase YdfG